MEYFPVQFDELGYLVAQLNGTTYVVDSLAFQADYGTISGIETTDMCEDVDQELILRNISRILAYHGVSAIELSGKTLIVDFDFSDRLVVRDGTAAHTT